MKGEKEEEKTSTKKVYIHSFIDTASTKVQSLFTFEALPAVLLATMSSGSSHRVYPRSSIARSSPSP